MTFLVNFTLDGRTVRSDLCWYIHAKERAYVYSTTTALSHHTVLAVDPGLPSQERMSSPLLCSVFHHNYFLPMPLNK